MKIVDKQISHFAAIDNSKSMKLFHDSYALIRKYGEINNPINATILRKMGKIHAQKLNHTNALGCFYDAIKIYSHQSTTCNIEIAHVLMDVAFLFHRRKNYKKVLLCCFEIIPVLEREMNEIKICDTLAKCRGLMAIAHDELKEFDIAMSSYQESIAMFNRYVLKNIQSSLTKDMEESYIFLASTNARKARLHERLNQDSLALQQYESKRQNLHLCNRIWLLQTYSFFPSIFLTYTEAFNVYKKILGSRQNLFVADILERMATVHGRNKKYDKAFAFTEMVLEIRMKILGFNHVKVAHALYSLGLLFDQNKEYDAAINSLSDCLEIHQITPGPTSLPYADTLAALGQSVGNQGDLKTAIEVWNEAIIVYETNGYKMDNKKIVALEKQVSRAEKLLKKSGTK